MTGHALAASGERGMVTAPHALAARAGAEMLSAGGTAADAAIAMAASLAVVYPHMTGIGGDAFWLYHHASAGTTVGYNGSGKSAALASLDYYADRGAQNIPVRGPLAVLTVPGAVDAWFALHARFGQIEMSRLLAPAIGYARDGVRVARSLAMSVAEDRGWLEQDAGAREIFLGPANEKDLLVQPALARTLASIASHGRDWLYRGDGAALISAWAQGSGSPLRAGDFAEHCGFETQPLSGRFGGYESMTMPPNSQGLALLIAQQVMETTYGSRFPEDETAELIHGAVEATKIAYEVRNRYVGDPEVFPLPATVIESAMQAPAGDGDTTYFACVDAAGNAASYIQSLFHGFGAGVAVPELGMVLQNRGIAFTLDTGGVRSLVPRRRPYHTLMPAMLSTNAGPAAVYGSRGGDAQPQFALALSIRLAKFGMSPEAAVSAPRWRWRADNVGEPGTVAVESRFSSRCIDALRARGHAVTVLGEWEESMGHAGVIAIDRARGVLHGAADPRSDGAAIGI